MGAGVAIGMCVVVGSAVFSYFGFCYIYYI